MDEEIAKFELAAFVSVRHASLGKSRLLDKLTFPLRGGIYRSPSSSAQDLASVFRAGTFSTMVKNAAAVVDTVALDHPIWAPKVRTGSLPVCVHVPSRALRERIIQVKDTGNTMIEVGDGLVLFIAKIAKIFGLVLHASAVSSLEKLLDIDPLYLSQLPGLSESFRDLLASVAICGHAGIVPKIEISPAAEQLASQLATAMLFFAISRAYVQYLSGSYKGASNVSAGLENFEASELFCSLEREIWTDNMALDLMARSASYVNIPNGIFTLVPFLFINGALAARRTIEKLEPQGQLFNEMDDLRAGLPIFLAERISALVKSDHGGEGLSPIICRNGIWVEQLLEALRETTLKFFRRGRKLGLSSGIMGRAKTTAAFWLTPMTYDADSHNKVPFYRLEDRNRVKAIHNHLSQLDFLRPYVIPYEYDVVICYRSSLYLETARRLGSVLRNAGIKALHDELFVPAGEDWEPLLQEAIASTRFVVMLISLIDLGAGLMDDLIRFPIMKETKWVGETRSRLFMAGVSHLEVEGEAGAIFRSMIDIIRTAADGMWVRKDFPVLMVQTESGLLPPEVEVVIAKDVFEELRQTQ